MHKILCILFICLVLSSISAFRRLNNFNDLRNVNYGKHSSRHGLKLLFWFVQRITPVDQNNNFLQFDPRRGDYGFHRFQNYEQILPPLIWPYTRYYSVGNINRPRPTETELPSLPEFVTRDSYSLRRRERNMDRLIVAVDPNSPSSSTRINRVFLTSHVYDQNSFEPSDTYEVAPEIIQQIRRPNNIGDFDEHLFNTLSQNINIADSERFTYESARGIFNESGLAAFLTLARYDVLFSIQNSINSFSRPTHNRELKLSFQPCQYDKLDQLKLEVRTTNNGYAKLIWENIPVKIEGKYPVQVAVCNAKYEDQGCYDVKTVDECSSFLDTSVPLNPGLQPRILITQYDLEDTITFYGPVFDDANRVIPTTIIGFDASLQLYTKDGWACARLFIKKTFSDWKNVFYNSWVGFYRNNNDANNNWKKWDYVEKFKEVQDGRGGDDYYVYKYESNLAIAPGVQIRFLLDKTYDILRAKTLPWEDPENAIISQ